MAREIGLHEWFDLLEKSGDQEVVQVLISSLDGYTERLPSLADRIQFINLFCAIRMEQMKLDFRRFEEKLIRFTASPSDNTVSDMKPKE